jgi:hypothetical protein
MPTITDFTRSDNHVRRVDAVYFGTDADGYIVSMPWEIWDLRPGAFVRLVIPADAWGISPTVLHLVAEHLADAKLVQVDGPPTSWAAHAMERVLAGNDPFTALGIGRTG